MDSTLILFTGLVSGSLGFVISSILTSRLIRDLTLQLQDMDSEFESLLNRKPKPKAPTEISE